MATKGNVFTLGNDTMNWAKQNGTAATPPVTNATAFSPMQAAVPPSMNFGMMPQVASQAPVGGGGLQPLFSGGELYNNGIGGSSNFDLGFGQFNKSGVKSPPSAKGGWMDGLNTAVGVAQVGLGVYNAMQQAKVNKFMQKYYGDKMALEKADFANAAHSTNEALTRRRERQLDSQGIAAGSNASKQQVGDYMKKWGVQETV